jgi:tRNA G37 N-methylase Trm5
MKNTLLNELSHVLMKHFIKDGHIVVDMTMGNGQDTLFVSKLCMHVYAFDIQEKALHETRKRLEEEKVTNVDLILSSHEHINSYVSHYDYVIFNLGHLPKGDKTITTKSDITLKTLDLVLNQLPIGGYVQLMVYIGHEEGIKESLALNDYFKRLSPLSYKISKLDLPYQDNYPPYIILIQKISVHDYRKKDGA